LPGLSKKKLSKVDTLRAAVVYIKQLQSLLAQTDAVASSHDVNEQFMSSQQLSQYRQQQQPQQPQLSDATFGDVNNTTSGFLFLPLLETDINSSVASYDVTATTSGLLPTPTTMPQPAPCATYSTGSTCLTLADVNDNNYVVAEHCPQWTPEVDVINMACSTEQQRLNELTAWLKEWP